jgi:hypothetical protein
MAYSTTGLHQIVNGATNIWVYDSADALATVFAASYIADATSSTTNSTPGRGMQVGDIVFARTVGAVPVNGQPPATATAARTGFVSALNTTTGAGSLTAMTGNT